MKNFFLKLLKHTDINFVFRLQDIEIKSYELIKNNKPKTAHKIRIKYSKLFICCLIRLSSKINKQQIVLIKRICFTFAVNKSKIKVF